MTRFLSRGLLSLGLSNRAAYWCLSAAILLFLGTASRIQAGYWRNSEMLFKRALAVTRENYLAHFAVAKPLYDQGRFKESLFHSGEAIKLKPNHTLAHYGHGLSLAKLGRTAEAAEHLRIAAKLAPHWEAPHMRLAELQAGAGRFAQSADTYRTALAIAVENGNEALAKDIINRLAVYRFPETGAVGEKDVQDSGVNGPAATSLDAQ